MSRRNSGYFVSHPVKLMPPEESIPPKGGNTIDFQACSTSNPRGPPPLSEQPRG